MRIAKIMSLVLLLSHLCLFGQNTNQNGIIGIYSSYNKEVMISTRLEIKADSSFYYSCSGMTQNVSSGKWKINNDTLVLYDFLQPYSIKNVVEKRIDSLQGVTIKIIGKDSSLWRTSWDYNKAMWIDTSKKTVSKVDPTPVCNFLVMVDNECESGIETDNEGKVSLLKKQIQKIRLQHGLYIVKDPTNNFFIVTLSNRPWYDVYLGFNRDKWLLKDGALVPIKCDRTMDVLKLERE